MGKQIINSFKCTIYLFILDDTLIFYKVAGWQGAEGWVAGFL